MEEYYTGSNGVLLADPLSMYKANKRKELAGSTIVGQAVGTKSDVDLSWIPFCAAPYNLSQNLSDYILTTVAVIPIGFPNRNGNAFLLEDLIKFNPEYGMQYYKTWRGKPTFYEHDNTDVTKANGVIVDVFLRKGNDGIWRIVLLMAFDRTKSVELINRVYRKEITTYSMGAFIKGGYTCSLCGAQKGSCTHMTAKEQTPFYFDAESGELVFKNGRLPIGFETSIVESPAWLVADSDVVMEF